MSRTVIPPAYRLMMMSENPPRLRACLGSSTGVNVPARSRGTSTVTGPTSVSTVFTLNPLREFAVPRPCTACFAYPRCSVNSAANPRSRKVRYLTAADLVEQLYRGLADNSVGRVIDTLLRNDLVIVDEIGFAPLDDTGTQLLFRFVAAAYERRALGVASHWPFEQWGRFLPEHVTATSLLDRLLHHATVVVTEGESFRMRQARTRTGRSRQ